MTKIRFLAASVALLTLVFGSVGASLAASTAERTAYLLGPGDKVRVTVFGEPDLSGDLVVDDQGAISLPLIGPEVVLGRTVAAVQKDVAGKFAEKYLVNPRVSVEVLNYRPFFILGEVRNPGSYPFAAGMTVVNAVAIAGGYTPRGTRRGITIKRANDPEHKEMAVNEDTTVLPGDVVRVPERLF